MEVIDLGEHLHLIKPALGRAYVWRDGGSALGQHKAPCVSTGAKVSGLR